MVVGNLLDCRQGTALPVQTGTEVINLEIICEQFLHTSLIFTASCLYLYEFVLNIFSLDQITRLNKAGIARIVFLYRKSTVITAILSPNDWREVCYFTTLLRLSSHLDLTSQVATLVPNRFFLFTEPIIKKLVSGEV